MTMKAVFYLYCVWFVIYLLDCCHVFEKVGRYLEHRRIRRGVNKAMKGEKP